MLTSHETCPVAPVKVSLKLQAFNQASRKTKRVSMLLHLARAWGISYRESEQGSISPGQSQALVVFFKCLLSPGKCI